MRRDVFKAISDPVRRQIIGMLVEEPRHLNAVAAQFNISRPAISRHMKILEECGVVAIAQQGRERYCSICPERLREAACWLEQFRQLWEQRLDRFEAYVQDHVQALDAIRTSRDEKRP
ncbi:MAG: metalloregulator ArsR/SmtB family transcription factor [Bacteroidota bacterium]